MGDIAALLERLRAARKPDNSLDIAVDIALFRPDDEFVSVAPNSAGTKLVYRAADGRTQTYWAQDHTLNRASIQTAIAALQALKDSSHE